MVIQPPAVTKTGEFWCILHTSEPGFTGGSLRCMVTIAAEVKVTFTGDCLQAGPRSWGAMLRTSGLPTPKEPVVIPVRSVEFSVVV